MTTSSKPTNTRALMMNQRNLGKKRRMMTMTVITVKKLAGIWRRHLNSTIGNSLKCIVSRGSVRKLSRKVMMKKSRRGRIKNNSRRQRKCRWISLRCAGLSMSLIRGPQNSEIITAVGIIRKMNLESYLAQTGSSQQWNY